MTMKGWNERDRLHHISCTLHSPPEGTVGFDAARERAERLAKYARKLGFDVLSENVDRDEP